MVARDIDLAGDTGQPVHLMHLSARESVEHLRRAHAAGIRASGEATPHHLCLTDEAVRTLDPNMKMNPPLRSEDDRAALVEAVRDGTIAAIATDHAPHSPEEKDVPFEAAPFGVTGLETSFAVLYTQLVEPGVAAARDGPAADVRRAGGDLRARSSPHRGRCTGESDAHRPQCHLAGEAVRLPLALAELLAARPAPARARQADDRGRPAGVRAMNAAALVLEDGTVFEGQSVGAEGFAFGEAVFTTSMSGYQEVATDPSFEGQIVCFTAPMVGNYGVDEARNESRRAHAKAVVMRDARGPEWTDWLHDRGVVGLTGVDTRSLVLHLRDRGAMRAAAVTGDSLGRRGAHRCARAAGDGRRRARLRRVGNRAVHVRRRGARAGGRGRLWLQALDPAQAGR